MAYNTININIKKNSNKNSLSQKIFFIILNIQTFLLNTFK